VTIISELPVATTTLWVLAGKWMKSISRHTIYMSITGGKYGKIAIYRPGTFEVPDNSKFQEK